MTFLQNPLSLFCQAKYKFPDPKSADEDGLVAIGGDMEPSTLLAAYSQGIFPWFVDMGYPYWFSPDPRAVLYPDEFKLSKSLSKSIKKSGFEFVINKNFRAVIEACRESENRKSEGSWITDEFVNSYTRLHEYGFAMSFECYKEGELVGGFYGVRLGRVFFGESMFYLYPDASKAALWFLCANAKTLNIDIIDCQQETPHLVSLGAKAIRREEFLEVLREKIAL